MEWVWYFSLKLGILDELQWKEEYFESKENYHRQRQKIELQRKFSKLKNGEHFRKWILCYYLLQLYNLLEFAFAEKDILIEECRKDKQKLVQNIENERKLASAELEETKWQIEDLKSRCWGRRVSRFAILLLFSSLHSEIRICWFATILLLELRLVDMVLSTSWFG